MIVKNFEIRNYIDKKNIFLIFGENEGLKEDVISEIAKPFNKDTIIKYDEKDILLNPDNLYNNIYSQSFFDNKKLILINDASDKFENELEKILSKKVQDVTIVLISKILNKKSKLRSIFEKEKDLCCVPVYKDDKRNLLNIAFAFFKSKNLNISTEAINLIVERSSEDRKNLRNELLKIESFFLNKKKVDIESLTKLTNLSENYDINKIVDFSLAKDTKQTLRALNENIFSNEDVIKIIRSYLIKSKRLLKLTETFEKNQDLEKTILSSKPPIFWKDKAIVKKQIQIWNNKNVKNLIQKINLIELQLKKNTTASVNIINNFIIEQSLNTNN